MAWTEPYLKNGRTIYRGRYRDLNGRPRTAGTDFSKRRALALAQDQEALIRAGTWYDPRAGDITFADYFERMWAPNRRVEVNTIQAYWSHYRTSLKPAFGDIPLRKLTPHVIQMWVTEQLEAGTSATTVRARFKTLQACLAAQRGASALRDRLIPANPCSGVEMPVVAPKPVVVYQPEEVAKILEALDPWWRTLVFVAAETGLRWGELMGLTAASLSPYDLTVTRTIIEPGKARTADGTRFAWKDYPKGKRFRTVTIDRQVATLVQAHITERDLSGADRLFSMPSREGTVRRTTEWPEGLPISRSFFRQSVWHPTLDLVGVERRRFHALRGTHISMLLSAGGSPLAVMERVGHRNISTTQRYARAIQERDELLDALATRRAW